MVMAPEPPSSPVTRERQPPEIKISTSGTFQVYANGFIGRSMGFTNTAGPEARPAVALRTSGDMIAIFNCRISGYQDTLYMNIGRQFFRNCVISGHVDYIFGDARVVIQKLFDHREKVVAHEPEPSLHHCSRATNRTRSRGHRAPQLQDRAGAGTRPYKV